MDSASTAIVSDTPSHAASPQARPCKICGQPAPVVFALPASKLTGKPIPDAPDDCPYHECQSCHFLFATLHDEVDNSRLYDTDYWSKQDPEWGGRVHQTLRLVMLGARMLDKEPWELDVLDFGCGMGTSVAAMRNQLQMRAWGTDIIPPRFGREWFLPEPQAGSMDLIVACEVIEHLPHPREILGAAARWLRPGGVLAFQTAYYDPATCGRDWWYLGPANGHISLYTPKAFEHLAAQLGVTRRTIWNRYPGLQAWKFAGQPMPAQQPQ